MAGPADELAVRDSRRTARGDEAQLIAPLRWHGERRGGAALRGPSLRGGASLVDGEGVAAQVRQLAAHGSQHGLWSAGVPRAAELVLARGARCELTPTLTLTLTLTLILTLTLT